MLVEMAVRGQLRKAGIKIPLLVQVRSPSIGPRAMCALWHIPERSLPKHHNRLPCGCALCRSLSH